MDAKEIAQTIIADAKKQGAEFAEVVVQRSEFMLWRIRQGQVDQPPAGEQWAVDLSLVKGNRRKAIQFDNPAFAGKAITQTLKQMEVLPEQELFLPTKTFPQAAQPEKMYDKTTAELNGEHALPIVKYVHEKLQGHNLFLSGKIAQSKGEVAYENSLGTRQYTPFTLASAAFFAFDNANPLISAYSNSGGASVHDIEKERMLKELLDKCALQQHKERVDLFAGKKEGEELRMPVICEPYIFGPIFEWLGFFGFNGMFVERGESFISNKIGQRVTGETISVADNPFDARNKGICLPFDFEGRPRSRLALIEKGVARNAVYDCELAQKWHKETTANALPPSARSEGAAPFDITVEGGNTSIEEMLQAAKEPTLWITKLHYLTMKHYQSATMSGVAQHGVFLVENGKVQAPVENMRFEENIPEALKRVEALSPSRLVFDPRGFSLPEGIVVPAMKINDFRFVGSTSRAT